MKDKTKYWLELCDEDLTDEVPPRTHDLHRLASLSGIFDELNDEQLDLLDKLNPLQIEARYPEYKSKIAASMSKNYCKELLEDTEGFLCWIKQKLET